MRKSDDFMKNILSEKIFLKILLMKNKDPVYCRGHTWCIFTQSEGFSYINKSLVRFNKGICIFINF